MTFSRKNLLLKWAYSPFFEGVPRYKTELNGCAIFWRSILFAPLFWAGIGGFLWLVGALLYDAGFWPFIKVISGVLAFAGVIVGIIASLFYVSREDTVPGAVLHGIKNKYCPRITLRD